MLRRQSRLDDLVTLAAARDADPPAPTPGHPAVDAAPPAQALADGSVAQARPHEPVRGGRAFAAKSAKSGVRPTISGPDSGDELTTGATLSGLDESIGAAQSTSRPVNPGASGPDAMAGAWNNPGPGDAFAGPAPASLVTGGWLAPQTSALAMMTDSGASAMPAFSKTALATTQPHQIDFTSGPLPVFGTNTSFLFSLPSFLYQQFSFHTGVSLAGFGLNAGVSITGGVKGSVALSLGQFTPDYPVTINPGVTPFVQDGQVFTIDPALVSTNDAKFSLSLPQLNANLDFGLQASAGITLSFPGIPIGVSLPFIGFVGYTLHIPSQSVGFKAGSIFKLPSNTTISIPGDGTVTLSQLQAKVINGGPQSAYESLPTLELSGNTDPFFVANTDLVSILAQEVPDPFAALQGSRSYGGVAGFNYKLLSLPLTGTLWLHEDVTLTPIAITETVTDTLTGQSQTGTLGQSFNFTAPSSGNGLIPLSITFGLEFSVHTSLELDGAVKLTLQGPSASASILGISAGVGPLGNFNLLDISGEILPLYSHTFTTTVNITDVVDVQNFATAVTETISAQSGAVSLTKPGTNLVVTAAGTVTGAAFGVKTGTLSAAMVTDFGLITVTGDGVNLQAGGTVDVQAGGRIIGHGATPGGGVMAIGNTIDAVTNGGTITGFAQGVVLAGGAVKNETGAVISATSLGVSIANANAVIVNNGSIQAATGVSLSLGGSLYNAQSGFITGGAYGVYAQGAVSVENHCTLTGGTTAIRALAGGIVTNLGGAYIHGGSVGVIVDGGANETLTNGVGGTISGGRLGVSLVGANVTVVNSGLISGGTLAAAELYGTVSNTLVIDPNAHFSGAVRFSAVSNTISLTAGTGGVGTLAGLGGTLAFQGTIAIGAGATWDIGGDFNGVTLSGLSLGDRLNDTAISYSAGERAVLNRSTDVLSLHAAGSPLATLGTIQLYGAVPDYGFTVTSGAGGGIDIAFNLRKLTAVSAGNGEVDISPTGKFGPVLMVNAGVVVSANYYGASAQAYGVLASQERATLTNFGTILGNNAGVDIASGGAVINEAGGTISGGRGVFLASNSVDQTDTVSLTNAGIIAGLQGAVYLNAAGTITNMAAGQITSMYLNGVQLSAVGTVYNQGTIRGGRSGANLIAGGFVYNENGALLSGHGLSGVGISGAYGKVANCGTISSDTAAGVFLSAGGLVVNETGFITGATVGVEITGGVGNVANAATIGGIELANGGMVVNAATGVISAAGGYGVSFYNVAGPVGAYLRNMGRADGVLAFGGDQIVNDGTIDGVGVIGRANGAAVLSITNAGTISGAAWGVDLAGAGSLANGDATHQTALIKGVVGVYAGSGAVVTITNFGTIDGTGGQSVQFITGSDRLIAEAGSRFIGVVDGGGGTLELAGGTGTITGLGGKGELSGAVAMTCYGFSSYQLDAGGAWTLTGTNDLTAADSLLVAGTLTIAGTVTNSGTITGLAGARITLFKADIVGGTLRSATMVSVGGTASILDGSTATLTNQASLFIADKGALTIKGALINSGKILLAGKTAATSLVVGAAGATLSGHGSVVLGANAFNTITGAATSATLTNVDNTISGSGQIGNAKLVLVNKAAGVIDQTGTVALTINTGTKAVSNVGIIEATGTGGATIAGAVVNFGVLGALKGNLTVKGAVTGGGSGVINAGTLTFTSTFSEAVKFTGSTGRLVLAQSQSYGGKISGFSLTGGTSLDLRDIGFVSSGEATFSGTTAGGVLTVTDGIHAAKINLTGNYTTSTWICSSDGAGGVIVIDPPGAPQPRTFATAMAGLAGSPASAAAPPMWPPPDASAIIARPGH